MRVLDPSVAMNDGILTTTVKNALNSPTATAARNASRIAR